MKKTIRLMPYSIYEAPALEEWFSAQSEKGLFLDSANWVFAVFSKGEPRKITYHLEVITGQDAMPNALPLFWKEKILGPFCQNNKKDTASGLF